MEDILEESRFLQDLAQKGDVKGLEEGKWGELYGILLYITTLIFPDIGIQEQKQSEQAQSQEQLRTMIDQLVTATTVQEARAALTS